MIADLRLFSAMYAKTIVLALNSEAPTEHYCWLRVGSKIPLHYQSIVIEPYVGLYAGPYHPAIGGDGGCGLTSIGSFSYSYSALPEGMEIGRYCSISDGLKFLDSNHPLDLITSSIMTFRPHNKLVSDFLPAGSQPKYGWHPRGNKEYPKIEHDVWIGRDVILSLGIRLGTGCVVAAGSVVTKDVAPYSIVGGNPATVIRSRFPHDIVYKLIESRWWEYAPNILNDLPLDHPLEVCERLAQTKPEKWSPTPLVISAAGFED